MLKIGFYICHCGINISHRVDVQNVSDFARGLNHVVVARDYKFMCSDPGQAMIEADIKNLGLNRVVVASCSPRLHGKTFMGACERAGLNPYYFQMASVREQVSWVTKDPVEATEKAKKLVSAAIHRVYHHEPLEGREAPVDPSVLIVGGGIAGMQAALDIGSAGHTVYLVEKSTTIGGHMLQFDKTFPTLDCAACIGTPKMVEVAQNPNIKVFSYSSVTDVSGFIGNYTITIRQKPRYVKEDLCTGCGECQTVCPVNIKNTWDEGMGYRKAIGRAFPQSIPITYQIEKLDRAPCVQACPAGVNVQGYVQLIGQGKYEAALKLIYERLPLPGVLGRVCPHPCETACRRKEVDEPISIRELKRFVSDSVLRSGGDIFQILSVPEIKEVGKKVAVVGSGPAGLSCAYYLRLKGYGVTLFESLDQLGGMLRVGIPDYRLPSHVLDEEINFLLKTGITVWTGCTFGRDITLASLSKDDFSSVFLSVGAHQSVGLDIPGVNVKEGLTDAILFLRSVNSGKKIRPGKHVIVVGGGNVAVDAARVAKRLGAETVRMIYRRTEKEMPAYDEEIEDAKAEGITLMALVTPIAVESEGGRLSRITCIRNGLGAEDESFRRRPCPIEGSEFHLECDCMITAIGQRVDTSFFKGENGLEWSEKDTLKVDSNTLETSLCHVFAGGDMVTGPATVIEAVAAGRKAAESIHACLSDTVIKEITVHTPSENFRENNDFTGEASGQWQEIPDNLPLEKRPKIEKMALKMRSDSFSEVAFSLTEEIAQKESARCLNCGGCSECMACVTACEANAIDHSMKPLDVTLKVGSIILATGYDTLDPTPIKPYGYGIYPNVYTALEFERLSNATGPTGGKLLMRDASGVFTEPPKSVALVHCVGSRDVHYHEYCSRVCCMYALKYTHLIKEKIGHDTTVYDFYIDMRCFGKGYEEFFLRCQKEGTRFIRGKVAEVSYQAATDDEKEKLIVIAEDTLLGEKVRLPVDMVILCTAIESRKDSESIGRLFGVSKGADGFFLEEHPKLAPLNTSTEGVFLAGCCSKPMDIPDTVSQASGAAAKSLSLASRGKVTIAPTISYIDPDICSGCQTCIGLCPYSAITFNKRKNISEVNPAICKGCGSCSAFCPSGAARSHHFRPNQVFAEIDGMMEALVKRRL